MKLRHQLSRCHVFLLHLDFLINGLLDERIQVLLFVLETTGGVSSCIAATTWVSMADAAMAKALAVSLQMNRTFLKQVWSNSNFRATNTTTSSIGWLWVINRLLASWAASLCCIVQRWFRQCKWHVLLVDYFMTIVAKCHRECVPRVDRFTPVKDLRKKLLVLGLR